MLHRSHHCQSGQHNHWIILCLVICVNNIQVANAAEEDEDAASGEYWSIQFENDFFAQSGDRYYTNGAEISRTVMDNPVPWIYNIASFFPVFESDGEIKGVTYTIGQKIFTPDDTETAGLVIDDRPYAGYLYISAAMLSRVSKKDNIDTGNLVELTLSIVGPSAMGEETQTGFHNLIGIDSPNGWDNQLEDELGFGLSYTRFWRYIKPSETLDYGATPHVNIVLGNIYTYAATGVMFRLGTYLNNDLSPPNIRPGFPGLSLFRPSQKISWYIFSGIEGRIVARNIFLDGNTFTDSHSVDKNYLVGDFQFGFVFQTKSIRFSISNMIRSKEFETQKDNTNFGAINISFFL
jgi:hypothetical protein